VADGRARVGVLISGRGSNLAALIKASQRPGYPAEIALVISNRPDAGGLAIARSHGIAAETVEHTPGVFEDHADTLLKTAGIEIVCLAGFMRILADAFVEEWRDRMLNIHPSLLPLFPGLDTHARALAAGVKIHGATVHYVRPTLDQGPIVAQGAVPVLPEDTAESLAARVLQVEHRIYPLALGLVADGRVKVERDRAIVQGAPAGNASLLSPPD